MSLEIKVWLDGERQKLFFRRFRYQGSAQSFARFFCSVFFLCKDVVCLFDSAKNRFLFVFWFYFLKILEIKGWCAQITNFLSQDKEKYLDLMICIARSRKKSPKRLFQSKVSPVFFVVFSFSTSFLPNSRDQSSVASMASKIILWRFLSAAAYESRR